MTATTDDLHIAKEELKEENFDSLRTCAGAYGSAEVVQYKGDKGESIDCVRVKVGELEGPLDLSRLHALADHLDTGNVLIVMHPTYKAADGVYATITAPRGTFSGL